MLKTMFGFCGRNGAAGATLFVVSAALLAGCAASPTDPRLAALAECVVLDSTAAQLACLEPLFEEALAADDQRGFLLQLHSLDVDGTIDDCHIFAHHFGHAAFHYEYRHDLTRTFLLGEGVCSNGYYHGVVESAIGGDKTPGPHDHVLPDVDLAHLCDGLLTDPQRYDACVHGVGHGLMYKHDHDITESLEHCQELLTAQARHRCDGGVFMQNAMNYLELEEAAYEQAAPLACEGLSLTATHFSLCYLNIGEIGMFYYKHDLARTQQLCDRISNAAGRAECHQGAKDEAEFSNRNL